MSAFSIITINLNNAVGLRKTIESVLSQTFKDFEYLVIDGGSTDGSVNLIKKYSDKITYCISEKDDGIYHAMNKGIEVAKGEYCLFLNSGDCLINNIALAEVFSKNQLTDLLACDMAFNYGSKKVYRRQPDEISFFYLMDTSLWHPATFIKRQLFSKYGKYDLQFKIAADYDFFLKTALVNKCSYSHIPVTVSVFDTKGISSTPGFLDQIRSERLLSQQKYFSGFLIEAAQSHNDLLKSDSYKLFAWLKRKKVFYVFFKPVFNILIALKRKISK